MENEVEWKMKDGKNEISIGKGPSLNYKFNKSYAGKKVYITAYITSTQSAFELPFPEQTTMCLVENAVEQKVLVHGVQRT
jgi:hypothetical protein